MDTQQLIQHVALNGEFQAACQRYARQNGSSTAIAVAAIRAIDAQDLDSAASRTLLRTALYLELSARAALQACRERALHLRLGRQMPPPLSAHEQELTELQALQRIAQLLGPAAVDADVCITAAMNEIWFLKCRHYAALAEAFQ